MGKWLCVNGWLDAG